MTNSSPYSQYTRRLNNTPQSEPIPGSNQVANSAGGYVWELDDWEKLNRFLILGTEGGTFYIEEKKLTADSAQAVSRCIASDGPRVVATIVEISTGGRAYKNDPAIFALALCMTNGNVETKQLAGRALSKVCRIGTHLFHFAEYINNMRGWGTVLKKSVASWYEEKSSSQLADQLIKYQQRDGWSHADLIKLSHPKSGMAADNYTYSLSEDSQMARTNENVKKELYSWVLRGKPGHEVVNAPLPVISAFEESMTLNANLLSDTKRVVTLITDFKLPRECVPTGFLNSKLVWDALLPYMGMEAMIRNLGNMSKCGLIESFSDAQRIVINRLGNEEELKRSRIHPMRVLVAMKVYAQGHGVRGSNSWNADSRVVDALDEAFYLTFTNVVPSNKRIMLCCDVSASMDGNIIANSPISAREGTAAMALITARTEPEWAIMGFTQGFIPLNISPKQRLDDVMKLMKSLPFEGTDCAVPMVRTLANKINVDTFAIYTDSETWAGNIHPTQALKRYRSAINPNAKLVVVGMCSNGFSIADPNDKGQLDVVGFDTETPAMISNFARN